MAYIAPASATAQPQTELSTIHVAGAARIGTTNLNAALVSATLIAAARHKAGFTAPRPSAPTRMYANPDGTVCTSGRRQDSLDFDRTGFHSHE